MFEVANYNDSPYCRLGHPTCFLDSDTILTTCRRENFVRQRPHAFPLCIFGETVMYAEQMMVLPKHVTRFNSGIWVGRCTISNAHLVVDGNKLFRTRTERRFPEGSERWNPKTMQQFSVNVTNPSSIPDVPTKRRDVSEHDEMDERLDKREHSERETKLIVSRNENEFLTTMESALDENTMKKETPNSLNYCWKMA